MKNKLLCIVLLCLLGVSKSRAQTDSTANYNLVQISGVVVAADSIRPIPFVNIFIKNSSRGTTSDYFGYFSLVAKENDSLVFSCVGYRRIMYVVPDTLSDQRYVLMQMLSTDTIHLSETVIYPWPTREQFREAFLNLHVPDDDMARAERNLNRETLAEKYAVMPMDGSMNHKYFMQQQSARLYSAGQLPPNHLLNPLAWVKFVEAWKRGDFKSK